MADLNTDVMRQLKDIESRLSSLEHHEFAILHIGSGAPGYTAAEGTMYWDYSANRMYVNDASGITWTALN